MYSRVFYVFFESVLIDVGVFEEEPLEETVGIL